MKKIKKDRGYVLLIVIIISAVIALVGAGLAVMNKIGFLSTRANVLFNKVQKAAHYGIMEATIPSADTLAVPIVKGDPSDNYYAKTRYAGFIVISKVGEVDINVSIPEVTIIPAGN